MMEPVMLTSDELEQIMDIQRKFAEISTKMGSIEFSIRAMEKQQEDLVGEFNALQEEDSKLLETLNGRYGEGMFDLQSGQFIPATSE